MIEDLENDTHWAILYTPGTLDPLVVPRLLLLSQGTEEKCWREANSWTERHGLKEGQSVRVLANTAVLGRVR